MTGSSTVRYEQQEEFAREPVRGLPELLPRGEQMLWQGVFVGALVFIVVVVWTLILPTVSELQAKTGDWTRLIVEIGLVSPLIWLGWFAAKQYGYTSRIREDYAFKSAAAMAYEGHKKAARETDQELERLLLEFSLFNMSQNPIRYRLTRPRALFGT